MIAHLGMYDLPVHNMAFWIAIRKELGFGPTGLTTSDDFWGIWTSPDLLLSQTCGFPFRARLHGMVQLVATPDYALPGCPPGYYNSVFIHRKSDDRTVLQDFQNARFAFNEPMSQSGWAAPIQHMAQQGVTPGALIQSGSHKASFLAVLQGAADFAALDALTWDIISSIDMEITEDVTTFDVTEPTPALPYITSMTHDANRLARAMERALATLPAQTRHTLRLNGLEQISAETYLAVQTPPTPTELGIPLGHLELNSPL